MAFDRCDFCLGEMWPSSFTNNGDKLRFYAKTGPTVLILVAVLTGTFICTYSPRFSVRAWNKITRDWFTHVDGCMHNY